MSSHGLPNIISTRDQLPSNLSLQEWDRIAIPPDDKQVVQMLKFGFPVGYTGPMPNTTLVNHPLASNHASHLIVYMTKELKHGAMLGPFSALPFYPWCQTNTLLTRPERRGE